MMTGGAAQALAQGTGTTQAPKKPAAKAPASKAPAAVRSTSRPAGFQPVLLHPEKLIETAPATYDVKFTTTRGDFVVRVTRAWAPLGADRFYNLIRHHYYDNASFFRVLPGFVVQFGLSAYPAVSKVWSAATIKDDRVKQSNKRGYLTFATAGPNTRTTQVFISLADNARLDSMGFAPFGEVVEGMNVVEMMYEGYGEGAPGGNGPRQDLIESRGKVYLDQNFPKLDSIKSAGLVAPGPPAAAAPPKQ
jgi:peptidyl-prolyl cis-trans isomerase A (cyclophilin A)